MFLICYLSVYGQNLDHYEFYFPTGTNQTAGDSFPLNIVAIDDQGDTFNYSFQAQLYTTPGSQYINPNLIYFSSGIMQGDVVIFLSDTLRIICEGLGVTDTSTLLDISPNQASNLLLLTPGENPTPGIAPGKIGSPSAHNAGENFDADVYLTDSWFNPVGTGNDSVYFRSTDQFASLPTGRLINGNRTFTLNFRTAGVQDLYIYDANSQIVGDTTSGINIFYGNYSQLLLLFPGETHLPGDTTTGIYNTPGKSGNPDPQYVGEGFPVDVYACDSFWNINTGVNNNQVDLHSHFWFTPFPSVTTIQNGIAQFDSVVFDSTDDNQDLWAQDLNSGFQSYTNYIDIYSRARFITAYPDSDTLIAGHTTLIHAQVTDINGTPLWDKPVYFEVISGNGIMQDTVKNTDTAGMAAAMFFSSSPYFDESDTIKITADSIGGDSASAQTLVSVYIQVPESLVTQGEIVTYPNPFGSKNRKVTLLYYLPISCNVKVLVYDTFGNPVRTWELNPGEEGAQMGINRFSWDGKDNKRRRVASGAYIVRVMGYSHTETHFNRTAKVGVVW